MSQSSHHTASLSTAQAMDLLNEEWNREVLPRLPEGWESQARQLGAFQRQRQIQAAGDLLRGLLAYVLGPLSFRGVGEWAVLIGLGDLSGSAWRRRLLRASRWLEWLVAELLMGVVPVRRDAGQT
nr:hypothetical protein [Ktedonobacteraceae bacterium]